jgi:hypothetical protein
MSANEQKTKILGPPVGYVDLLNQHTEAKSSGESKKYMPLRPSSAGKCGRELAYEYDSYKNGTAYPREAMAAETSRIFSLGHSVEYNVNNEFRVVPGLQQKYKQQVVRMFKLDDGTIIEGSVDNCFFLDHEVDGKQYRGIVDFKSKKDKFSSWTKSQWDEFNDKLNRLPSVLRISDTAVWIDDLGSFLQEVDDPFLAANFLQLNFYACTDFIKESGIDHGAIIQYNKNDSRLREIRFRPSQEVFDSVRDKFTRAANAITSGAKPDSVPRDYALGSIKCAFCPFKKQCWGENTDALKAWFKTFPYKNWPVDTSKLGDTGTNLEDLFEAYKQIENSEKEKKRIESLICLEMSNAEVEKIKLEDGSVYEMKALATGLAIRRGKL